MSLGAWCILASATLIIGCGDENRLHDAGPPADGRIYAEHDARPGVDCRGKLCALGVACCYQVIQADKPQRITYCAFEGVDAGCPETTFECDGPEDCDSGVCCATAIGLWTCAAAGQCIEPPACHAEIDCNQYADCCETPSQVIKICAPGGCPP